jgi:hypothetical protein
MSKAGLRDALNRCSCRANGNRSSPDDTANAAPAGGTAHGNVLAAPIALETADESPRFRSVNAFRAMSDATGRRYGRGDGMVRFFPDRLRMHRVTFA